ncbi:uncharacterized protein LOC100888607 isoform X2 [Strongylocentrotus purpuratus]|uniref:Sodefrin-like factor n=1 Tax=Strongylocentrotus purpuratus TaxID=7668 RepID=A0A7M7NB99_STRPU|nr:uncharacterized protein LOC100888607 isoform X2 [Strongylocentrotus purpuratus]
MNLLVVIGLLFGIFTTGKCKTCLTCKEVTSNDFDLEGIEQESCSDNPSEMTCPEGISTCMTGVIDIAYRLQSGQNVTIRDEKRACAPEEIISSIPSGDHCVEQSVVDAYFSDNDPTELYPDLDGMLFLGITNATFCVCDSSDKCTPPSPTGDSPAPAAESEPSPEAESSLVSSAGNFRTCLLCKEVTSKDLDLDGIEQESCSDNPDEMICPDGISTCMTGVIDVAYRLQSGQNVTIRDEKRACAPEGIVSSIPSGDHCVEQSVVDAYFSDIDPTELYPDLDGMLFLGITNATFCVCDSADKCSPPSPTGDSPAPAAESEPSPEAESSLVSSAGNFRTCLLCKEVTSNDLDLDGIEQESCSDNPDEMICPDGISTCMTGVIDVAYRLQSGQNVTIRDEKRACAPEEIISSIPSGDHCVEQSVVDAYFSDIDPTELYPDLDGMLFLGITNATFCVCDSADKCSPPSPTGDSPAPAAESEPSPEAESSLVSSAGNFRTCLLCKEVTSNDLDLDGIEQESCSDSPDEMICPDGISTCMTGVIDVAYRLQSGQNVTIRDEKRACAPEGIVSSIPSGDHCVEQSVVDAYFSDNDPAELYPDLDGMLFLGITNATFCVCDSADKCTPPSPTFGSPSTDAEGGTGTGKGDLRTCITCKEITSDGNIIDPGDTELVSCSDNPGEMICPEGISTCMTGVVNIAYMLGSGQTVTLTDELRACAPKDVVASTSPGDHCVDQSVVGAYFSDNDPAELYPDTEEMMFDRLLNATFCVCDSADKCTPPSQASGAKAWANTGGADGHTKPTNSVVNLESTLGLFICSLIYALFLFGFRDRR